MRGFLRLCLVLGCWSLGSIDAKIVEVNSSQEILSLISDEAVVLFDLDDTLMCYPGHLGSEPWFCAAKEDLHPLDCDQIAGLLAQCMPVVPVEVGVLEMIHSLQRRGFIVGGITARESFHPAVSDWREKTIDQINSLGIDFRDTFHQVCRGLDYKGVLFTGRGYKGRAVVELLTRLPISHLVLIDDRYDDLYTVEQALAGTDTEFLGIWYRKIEERRNLYDPECAAVELEQLLQMAN